MAALLWKTDKTAEEARALIQAQLQKTGYGDQVTWEDTAFSASAGMGFMLDISGFVKDRQVVIEKCGGVSGSLALGKLKKMFEYLFPGGEVVS